MSEHEDLQQVPIGDIRSERTALISEETGLSYLRRMVQGPLDIVRRERELRSAGTTSDLASMVEGLPDVLADGARTGGNGRLSAELEPHEIDPDFEAERDQNLYTSGVIGNDGFCEGRIAVRLPVIRIRAFAQEKLKNVVVLLGQC